MVVKCERVIWIMLDQIMPFENFLNYQIFKWYKSNTNGTNQIKMPLIKLIFMSNHEIYISVGT